MLHGPAPTEEFVGNLMMKAVRQGKDPLALLPSNVNTISQMDCCWPHGCFPQMEALEELVAAYPNAKFILSIQNAMKWVQSVDKYGQLRRVLIESELPGLPAGVGAVDDDLIAFFQAHVMRVRSYFANHDSQGFLELDLDDGDQINRSRLSDFFGQPVAWDHHNVTTWGVVARKKKERKETSPA